MMIASIAVLTIAAKRASVCASLDDDVEASPSDRTRRVRVRRPTERRGEAAPRTCRRSFIGANCDALVGRRSRPSRADCAMRCVAYDQTSDRREVSRPNAWSCVPASLARANHSSGRRTAWSRARDRTRFRGTMSRSGSTITGQRRGRDSRGAADALNERAVQIGAEHDDRSTAGARCRLDR